jgi:hypothetical protein
MSRTAPRCPGFQSTWLGSWWPRALALALMLLAAAPLGAATASISTVAIVSPQTDYAPSQGLLIDVTFSEAVTVTGTPSFNLSTGGTATYVAGSGTAALTFAYTIAASDHTAGSPMAVMPSSKISTANVACVVAADTPGSWGWPGSGLTPNAFIAPFMTAASFGTGPYTDLTSLTCTFTCSEALTSFASADVALGGTATATIGTITRSGTTVTVPLTVTAIGTLTVGVSAGSAAHDADNNAIDSTSSAVAAITVGPVPVPVAIQAVTASPTAATTAAWTVSFNTPVQGVNAGNFQAGGSGLAVSFLSVSAPAIPSASWTVTANGVSGSGTLSLLILNMTGVADSAGEAASSAIPNPDQSITVDQASPTITSFAQSDPATSSASVRHYTVNFSAPVVGVSAANFTVAAGGGAAGAIGAVTRVSGSAWTVTLVNVGIAAGSGTVGLNVSAAGITDTLGNPLGAVASCPAYTVVPIPTLTAITTAAASPTNAASVVFTATFNVAVSGVSTAALSASGTGVGGTVSAVSPSTGSAASFQVTVSSIGGTGTLTLGVGNLSAVVDASNDVAQPASPSPSASIAIDQTAPVVSSVSLTGPAAGDQSARSFLVTFSKPVSGFSAASVTLAVSAGMPAASLGTIVPVGANSYSVPVTNVSIASGSGTLGMSINPAGIADALGNALSAAMPIIPTYTVVPVPSLLSIATAQPSPTNAGSLSYTVSFNVPVSGLTTAQFGALVTGTATATVSGVTPAGSSSAFTVTLSPVGGDGTLKLGLLNLTGVVDGDGDAVAASSLASAPITLDHTAPTIQSITVAGANPTNAANVNFLVQFSEPVAGVTSGSFAANGIGGSITAVQPSGASGELVTVAVAGSGAVGVTVGGGITDLAGNALVTTAPANDEQCQVERTAPAIQSITLLDANPSSEPGPVRYAVTFSVPVGNVAAANFSVPTASLATPFPTIATPTPVGAGPFASTWVVQVGAIALAVNVTNTQLPLQFTSAGSPAVEDQLGNIASSALPGSNVATYTITIQQPGLALGTPQTFTERGPAVSPFAGTVLSDPGTTQFVTAGQHGSIDVSLSLSSPVAVAPLTVSDDPSDALWLAPPSGFSLGATAVSANTDVAVAPLLQGATQVGTVTFTPSLTQDQSFLHIDLTGSLLVSDVQNLIDGISFDNPKQNPSASQRQLFLSVIDGTGRASTPVAQHLSMILVNDSVPLVPGLPEITTAPAPRIVIPGQTLTGHISTNDVDSFFTCALVDGAGGLHPATASTPASLPTAQGTITVTQYGDWTYVASATASGVDGFQIKATDIGPNQGVFSGGDALLAPAIISQPIFVVAISSGPSVPLITTNPPVEAEVGGTFDYVPAADLGLDAAQISQSSYDLVELDAQGFVASHAFAIDATTGEITCANVPAGAGGYLQIGILLQVTDTTGTTRGTYQPILLRTVSTNGAGG